MIKKLGKIGIVLIGIFIAVAILTNPVGLIQKASKITGSDTDQVKALLKEEGILTNESNGTNGERVEEPEIEYQTNQLYRASVTAEIDGNTFYVKIDGESQEKKIRLIGITCEETAADYTKDKIPVGTTIWLQFDKKKTNDEGLWLAYAWLKEDVDINSQNDAIDYMLNIDLLINGHANPLEDEENTKYIKLFNSIQALKEVVK